MNSLSILCTILLITTVSCEENASETNEVIPTESTQNHSPHLRRIIIPVDPVDNDETPSTNDQFLNNLESITAKDEILEESTVRDKMSVHFYSANVDMETTTNTENDLLKYLLEKVGNPANNQSQVIIKYTPTKKPVQSEDSDSELKSGNETSLISTNIEPNEPLTSQAGIYAQLPIAESSTSGEPTETTTKKPAPTHNEDGENIEVVDKEDIRILEAPLVSAFTVHQDGIGVPKKVIPLIPPTIIPTPIPVIALSSITFPARPSIPQSDIIAQSVPTAIVTESPLIPNQPVGFQLPVPSFLRPEALQRHQEEQRTVFTPLNAIPTIQQQLLPPEPEPIGQQQLSNYQFQPAEQFLTGFPGIPTQATIENTQQISINQLLLERQKLLEEQIYSLQNQARHQQQQILLQQQLLQEHRRKRFESQTGQPNQLIPNNKVVNNSNKLSNEIPNVSSKSQLEIIPSVTQSPRYEISNQQHLPIREAINFHSNPTQLIQQQQQLQQQQPKSTNVQIQSSNEFDYIQPQQQQKKFVAVPFELSSIQQLPQKQHQQFKSNPNIIGNYYQPLEQVFPQQQHQKVFQQQQQLQEVFQQQQAYQQQQQQLLEQQQFLQQQPKSRFFRQNYQIGNFGSNNILPSGQSKYIQQSFSSQVPTSDSHLQSLLYQSALNHGINPHTQQNLQIPWPFGSF